jgi:hypothetical protein
VLQMVRFEAQRQVQGMKAFRTARLNASEQAL